MQTPENDHNFLQGVKSVTALLLQQHCVLDVAIGPALQSLQIDKQSLKIDNTDTFVTLGIQTV